MSIQREAYSIDEFCEAFHIGRSKLYDLWEVGDGPSRMRVGNRWLITVDAARAWAKRREQKPRAKRPKPADDGATPP